MSTITLSPAATGAAQFTIASPATATNRTLTLPDEAGTVLTSASNIEAQAKTALNATGAAPVFACRAWVNFNGTGTVAIRASGNVSSITDNGVGDYRVNFATAMPDINYSVVVTSRRTNSADMNFAATLKPTATPNTSYPLTTSSCDVICGTVTNAAFIDSDVICVAIFR